MTERQFLLQKIKSYIYLEYKRTMYVTNDLMPACFFSDCWYSETFQLVIVKYTVCVSVLNHAAHRCCGAGRDSQTEGFI